MPATRLDAVGTQKMKALDQALTTLQTIHGMVERMALEVKDGGPAGVMPQQIKRVGASLQGQLTGHFDSIADDVATMILGAGRRGGELMRVRTLRESVAQIRIAIEIAMTLVKQQHSVEIRMSDD